MLCCLDVYHFSCMHDALHYLSLFFLLTCLTFVLTSGFCVLFCLHTWSQNVHHTCSLIFVYTFIVLTSSHHSKVFFFNFFYLFSHVVLFPCIITLCLCFIFCRDPASADPSLFASFLESKTFLFVKLTAPSAWAPPMDYDVNRILYSRKWFIV